MQGELARSGSPGRAQFGGGLRLGDRHIPILRLGVGGQGVSHAAVFNGTEEPEVPFEFSELWYAGAGLDVRLGDHFIAGIALSVEGCGVCALGAITPRSMALVGRRRSR